MELIVLSPVRISTIFCFASSVTILPMHVLLLFGSTFVSTLLIEGLRISMYQSGDQITMGSMFVSTVAFFHKNCGSKVESQGYPNMTSSMPRSITKNLIFFSCPLVCTKRSTKCVSLPALFVVPSMFQIFMGHSSSCIPTHSLLTNFGYMKLLVAPESTRIHLLAMV